MTAPRQSPRRRPPRRRRRASWLRPLALVAAGLLLFLLGIGLGRALEEEPAGGTRTQVRTLRPVPLSPAQETVTVTVTGTSR